MHGQNRDLLVLLKQDLMTPQAMEHEVERLHELLYMVEKVENLIIAHEIIDINKYKVTNKSFHLHQYFRQKNSVAFVFLNCKN